MHISELEGIYCISINNIKFEVEMDGEENELCEKREPVLQGNTNVRDKGKWETEQEGVLWKDKGRG